MRYFKRRWEEHRDDQYSSWGPAVWLFEVDDEMFPLRQIQIYDAGPTLKYSREKRDDAFGGLGDQPLDDTDDWASFEVPRVEFDAAWARDNR